MKRRTLAGIISGLIYGVVIFWGAAHQAFGVGGSIALATSLVGFLGAIGGGGLVGVTVAVGVVEEIEEQVAREPVEPPVEHRAAA